MYRIDIQHNCSMRGLDIWIGEETNGIQMAAKPIELCFEPYDSGCDVKPTLSLSRGKGDDFLRALVNELVRCGYKPDEIKAIDKEIGAVKYHLEDMRKLVFKHEGI